MELRNIYDDRQHFDELRAARGRTTVPVLRITSSNGEDRWMPESADIVRLRVIALDLSPEGKRR